MKAAVFHPAAIAAIRLFPRDARRELGKAIFDLQKGEVRSMPLSRPMPSVASGVEELRNWDLSCFLLFEILEGPSCASCLREKEPGDAETGFGPGEETAEGV